MSTVRAPAQDMPPKGGFARFNFQRHIPAKGFSGITLLGMVSASVGIGFALYAQRQGRINETRLARQQERKQFLQQLDGHLSKKFLDNVERQAMEDVLAMERLAKGDGAAKHH